MVTAPENASAAQQVYGNSEVLQPTTNPESISHQVAPVAMAADDLSYWQALVDPNTNHTYYWNSLTNVVSWTIPGGGVISLPRATEEAVVYEREVEEVMESYPYSAKLPAKFTKAGTIVVAYMTMHTLSKDYLR